MSTVAAVIREQMETTLDLSNSDVELMEPEDLAALLAAAPSHIDTIDLSSNDLQLEHAASMQAIPAHVVKLNLSNNFTFENLATVEAFIANLPPTIQYLELSNVNLAQAAIDELDDANEIYSKLFKLLPSSVRRVDLSGDGLYTLSLGQLELLLESLPQSVETIDLTENYLHIYEPVEEVANILLKTDKNIIINENTELKAKLQDFFYNKLVRNLAACISYTDRAPNNVEGRLLYGFFKGEHIPLELKCEVLSHVQITTLR